MAQQFSRKLQGVGREVLCHPNAENGGTEGSETAVLNHVVLAIALSCAVSIGRGVKNMMEKNQTLCCNIEEKISGLFGCEVCFFPMGIVHLFYMQLAFSFVFIF